MSEVASLGAYEYVICGGGTAGLVLASRLSEVPSISVAVLEAGVDRSDDVNVLAPGLLTALYGNPDYDWIYTTTPQASANERVIGHPRGKQLGGSSAINYLAYTHASQQNIDDWGELGNEGWSPLSTVEEALDLSSIDTEPHGQEGEIRNGFPGQGEYSSLDEAWPRTYSSLGLGVSSDPRDGKALGGYTILTNMDRGTNTRSYAATTYLGAARNRTNLHVYTSALVSNVNFDTSGPEPTATGVSFSINGTAHTIEAKQEVILSAGSFGSPQILKRSGIGTEDVLCAAGVEPIVCNDNVGKNLQDHVYMPLGFEVNPGIFTLDDLANETIFNAAFDEYLANATGPLATVALGGALLSMAHVVPSNETYTTFVQQIKSLASNTTSSLATQHRITTRNLLSPHEAAAQHMNTASGINPTFANDTTKFFSAPTPGNYFTILAVLEHPYSRGTVHITSSDPSTHPAIDPKYFSHPADVLTLSHIALQAQNTLARSSPLADLLVGNGTVLQPEYTQLKEENVESEIRRLMQSEHHPAGTCAMMPRERGDVVDEKFRVYGVKGVRVVDASVVPLLPRANLQTLIYALAERAAGWVLEGAWFIGVENSGMGSQQALAPSTSRGFVAS